MPLPLAAPSCCRTGVARPSRLPPSARSSAPLAGSPRPPGEPEPVRRGRLNGPWRRRTRPQAWCGHPTPLAGALGARALGFEALDVCGCFLRLLPQVRTAASDRLTSCWTASASFSVSCRLAITVSSSPRSRLTASSALSMSCSARANACSARCNAGTSSRSCCLRTAVRWTTCGRPERPGRDTTFRLPARSTDRGTGRPGALPWPDPLPRMHLAAWARERERPRCRVRRDVRDPSTGPLTPAPEVLGALRPLRAGPAGRLPDRRTRRGLIARHARPQPSCPRPHARVLQRELFRHPLVTGVYLQEVSQHTQRGEAVGGSRSRASKMSLTASAP